MDHAHPRQRHLQQAARDHLWMHFTRTRPTTTPTCPSSCAARAPTSTTPRASATSTASPGLFVSQLGHGRTELAEAAAKQAEELAFMPLWSYAHPNAIELAERVAGYAPGDLNRVFFTTGGGEAVETAWKLAKNYFKLTGKPIKHKVISRAIAYHGTPQGALSITGLPGHEGAVRAAGALDVPGAEHQLLPRPEHGATTTSRPSAAGPPTRSPSRSRTRAPTRSPRCSSSRCRTPAAASRRRPATSSGSARSATSTTCCWSPTRSSAPSAGSATCSAPSATATSPTSSPAPRASPPATPRWAR